MSSKVKNWILVFIWASFIFFLSHQPFLKSDFPNQLDFILRKIAHFSEYAILTWLLIRALKEYGLTNRKILILAISMSFLYAVSDEYHQTFILGRQGAFRDVFIDSVGILITSQLARNKKIP